MGTAAACPTPRLARRLLLLSQTWPGARGAADWAERGRWNCPSPGLWHPGTLFPPRSGLTPAWGGNAFPLSESRR